MARIFYHNLTKRWYNKSCLIDVVESADPNDIIKFSVAGNALLFDIIKKGDDESLGEFDDIRQNFLQVYKELNGECYGK